MNTNYEQRAGFKWTINECLRLQREFELLNLPVEEIALLHKRSPYAIMCKLDAENIADFNELYQQTYPNKEEDKAQDEESEAEDEESEAESEAQDEESDEEYDRYDMKQQVRILTKQLTNLTAVVYKYMVGQKNDKHSSTF